MFKKMARPGFLLLPICQVPRIVSPCLTLSRLVSRDVVLHAVERSLSIRPKSESFFHTCAVHLYSAAAGSVYQKRPIKRAEDFVSLEPYEESDRPH